MPVRSYEEAGVSIDKGDKFASFIGSLKSKAVSRSIGGFAGGIAIDTKKYKNPIMLSTTDGVGTKLMIAQELGIYDTVGIDLVAMSVNDLIVCGAAPQTFLDYIACGKIHEEVLHQIIKGVVDGCEQAECTLAGGETAEMPDVYGAVRVRKRRCHDNASAAHIAFLLFSPRPAGADVNQNNCIKTHSTSRIIVSDNHNQTAGAK